MSTRAFAANLSRSTRSGSSPARALLGVPVIIAVINAVALLLKLPKIVPILYLNSDTASAPVLGSLNSSHQVVTLGNYPWYESLWFMKATIFLPAHRSIWQVAPIVWTVVGFALLVWVALVLFGRYVALMIGAILACVAPTQQWVFFTLDTHGPLLVHSCVLLAVLVWLTLRRRNPSFAIFCVTGVLLTAFTAMGTASDALTYVACVIPFVLAALVSAWRSRRAAELKIAVFAVAVAVSSTAGGEVVGAVMRAAHWSGTPLRTPFVAAGRLPSNLEVFAKAFSNLAGGDFFDVPAGQSMDLTIVAGVLCFVALALVTQRLVRLAPSLTRRMSNQEPRQVASAIYIVFWGSALVGVSAVFLLTSVPQDSHAARYLAIAYIAVAALLPLVVGRDALVARLVLACGIGVFAIVTTLGTLGEPDVALYKQAVAPTPATAPTPVAPPISNDIERFVRAHGASTGYARYWDAAALSWQSDLRVMAYPAWNCLPGSAAICPYFLNFSSSWYQARPHTRTFLVVDATLPDPLASDPALGRPAAIGTFGSVTVEVYDYDIASKMSCGPPDNCTGR
jgi:hypothetical protein